MRNPGEYLGLTPMFTRAPWGIGSSVVLSKRPISFGHAHRRPSQYHNPADTSGLITFLEKNKCVNTFIKP